MSRKARLKQIDLTNRRLLYVALTRAREKLIIEWPDYLRRSKAKTPTFWLLLSGNRCNLNVNAGEFTVRSTRFPCKIHRGDDEYMVPVQGQGTEPLYGDQTLPQVGWRAIRKDEVPRKLTLDIRNPSGPIADDEMPPEVESVSVPYGDGLLLQGAENGAMGGIKGHHLGTFLHECFEVLGSRPELLEPLAKQHGVDLNATEKAAIKHCVAAFEAWINKSFDPIAIMREWPLLVHDHDSGGSIMSGKADVVIDTSDGMLVLDHKSDLFKEEERIERIQGYRGQMKAYVDMLDSQGKKVLGVGIHWIRRGEISWLQVHDGMMLPPRGRA